MRQHYISDVKQGLCYHDFPNGPAKPNHALDTLAVLLFGCVQQQVSSDCVLWHFKNTRLEEQYAKEHWPLLKFSQIRLLTFFSCLAPLAVSH